MSEKKINKVQDLSQSVKQRTVNFLMKQKSLGELNKEKIMQTLAFNHPNGRTTHELKIDTGLDRDTIYTHGEDLKKSGLVIKKVNLENTTLQKRLSVIQALVHGSLGER